MADRGPAGNGGFKLLQPRRADFEQKRSKSVVCGRVKVGRRKRSPMQNQMKHLKMNTKARPRALPKGNSRQAEIYGTECPPKGARHRFNHNNHKRNHHYRKRNNRNNTATTSATRG